MNCIAFLTYDDADAAVDWLERAFGFERSSVHEADGKLAHAELRFGDGMIMLGPAGKNDFGAVSQGVYLIVDDIAEQYDRARTSGAEILRELADTDYGSREFMARDPEGNIWSFGTYRPE